MALMSPGYAGSAAGFTGFPSKTSTRSTEVVNIDTDFTVEDKLSKNLSEEGGFVNKGTLTLVSHFFKEGNVIAERQVRCGRQLAKESDFSTNNFLAKEGYMAEGDEFA